MTIQDIIADPEQAAECLAESSVIRRHLREIIEQYRETGGISAYKLLDAELALKPHSPLCFCSFCLPWPKEPDASEAWPMALQPAE